MVIGLILSLLGLICNITRTRAMKPDGRSWEKILRKCFKFKLTYIGSKKNVVILS